MGDGLSDYFEQYLKEDSLFTDKSVLHSSYTPKQLEHRQEQIKLLADILAPALKQNPMSNVFIYGKTGTGKTVTVSYITENIEFVAQKQEVPLKVCYINCKLKRVADTEYRLIAELARNFNKAIPPTGLPTDEVYKIFYAALEQQKGNIILVLDEVDQLVKKCGDEILYNLTRLNSSLQNAKVSLIGISNDLLFTERLDPRVVSSLSEEELVFPPYNALQIKDILLARSAVAFKPDTLSPGVIEKCAAYAAKEHGDVRRAIELLRVAGEIAERQKEKNVNVTHLDDAEKKMEKDKVITLVSTQPKQQQYILYAILAVAHEKKDAAILTGHVYDFYTHVCSKSNVRPLTQRRVSDIITEFDMLGLISTQVISKGRFGRTRQITITIPEKIMGQVQSVLEQATES